MADQKFFILDTGRGTPSVTLDPIELATKTYVAAAIHGIDWQESVQIAVEYVKPTTGAPTGAPAAGETCLNTFDAKLYTEAAGAWDAGVAVTNQQRFVHKDTGSITGGTSGTHTKSDKIYLYNVDTFEEFSPSEGSAVFLEDTSDQWLYSGTAWVKIGTTVVHNDLASKQGGTTDEFYHITSDQEASLDAATTLTASNPPTTLADRALDPTPVKYAYLGGLAISQANIEAYEVNGVFKRIVMPFAGSVVRTSAQVDSAVTAGSLVAKPTKNGTAFVATDLDLTLESVTNTLKAYASVAPATTNLTFAAGDEVGVKLTTDGTWAPVTSNIEYTMFVVFNKPA